MNGDKQRIRPFASHKFKRGIDLAGSVGVVNLNLQSQVRQPPLARLASRAGILIGSRVDEDRYTSQAGYQIANKLQPFRRQLDREKVDCR